MILEVEHVYQSFRTGFWMKPVEVLQDVSLSVPEGAIFGFLGANGAGKTTLIHLITGIRKPRKGSVRVRGLDALTPQSKALMGYLPERPYFYEHLTGEALLKYFAALSGMKRSHVADRIPKVLKQVGIYEARRIELAKYSKGMLQRIGIAQAILHDPEFLVLDEPMSGLDPLGRKEIRELIVELASQGHTIFFSSHVIPDVEAICSQVGLIQKGKVVGCGPIGKLLAQGPLKTEIAFTGVNEKKAASFKRSAELQSIPDGGLKAVLSGQDSVNGFLEKILEANGTVLWVTPIRPSLESFFVSEKRKNG